MQPDHPLGVEVGVGEIASIEASVGGGSTASVEASLGGTGATGGAGASASVGVGPTGGGGVGAGATIELTGPGTPGLPGTPGIPGTPGTPGAPGAPVLELAKQPPQQFVLPPWMPSSIVGMVIVSRDGQFLGTVTELREVRDNSAFVRVEFFAGLGLPIDSAVIEITRRTVKGDMVKLARSKSAFVRHVTSVI